MSWECYKSMMLWELEPRVLDTSAMRSHAYRLRSVCLCIQTEGRTDFNGLIYSCLHTRTKTKACRENIQLKTHRRIIDCQDSPTTSAFTSVHCFQSMVLTKSYLISPLPFAHDVVVRQRRSCFAIHLIYCLSIVAATSCSRQLRS